MSPVLRCHIVSPLLQGLVLPGVSTMCATCALLFFSGHFILQASCFKALFVCYEQCFVPWLNVVHFNLGVLWSVFEMRPVASAAGTKTLQNSCIRRLVVERDLGQPSGGGGLPCWH